MKTLFITSFHPLISRNILAAGVLNFLKKNNLRIVILVPVLKVDYFRERFLDENVVIEPVTIKESKFIRILDLFSLSLVGTDNHIIDDLKLHGKWGKFLFARFVRIFFGNFFIFHKITQILFSRMISSEDVIKLFEKYKPNALFSTDIFSREDAALLLLAKKLKVTTIGMVRSWDNTTTKGVLLVPVDFYIAPNVVLKSELISFHHVPEEQITITGLPHHDSLNDTGGVSREEYFKSLGLDVAKKTILYTVRGKMLFEHDNEFLKLFQTFLNRNVFNEATQFLVFLPPADVADISPIENDSRFTVRALGRGVTLRKKDNELSLEDNIELNNAIRYSDVMLTLGGTTMTIDGTILGCPVIALEFDPAPNLKDSVLKFKKIRCFEKLLASGPVTVSKSPEQLVKQINAFFENRDLNIEERVRTTDAYAYLIDGHSSERVSNVILRVLGE